MNALTMIRLHNRILGAFAPNWVGRKMARLFLTPRRLPLKQWEIDLEQECRRVTFAKDLSAAVWGQSDKKVLLVHGWESRATHMSALVQPLVDSGYEVVALDAPKHGQSGGAKANVLAFAEAIVAADLELGPFVGAVGHSMGGAALTVAMELGAYIPKCVLISSPASILDVLQGFAGYMGMHGRVQSAFIYHIESEVGVPAKQLNMGRILAEQTTETLLIHSDDDREIPVTSVNVIAQHVPSAQTLITKDLGHRKIIKDSKVAKRIEAFMQGEHLSQVG